MSTPTSQETLHTFLFADMAGYTALTEAHGDQNAADLADEFCTAVREVLPEYSAEAVKALGDALMIRVDDAAAAIVLGLRIANEIGRRHNFPGVRVGMHTGCAIKRDDDWFGATVNLAARISGAARAGEVLLSGDTRAAAGHETQAILHDRGRQAFKNVAEPVSIHAAVERGPAADDGFPIDPVCRMAVDPERSAGSLNHEGVEYSFCSLACVQAFSQAPETHAQSAPGEAAPPRSGTDLPALVRAASYVVLGLFSVVGRRDLRRVVHSRAASSWILDAHAIWLVVVGSSRLVSAARSRSGQATSTRA